MRHRVATILVVASSMLAAVAAVSPRAALAADDCNTSQSTNNTGYYCTYTEWSNNNWPGSDVNRGGTSAGPPQCGPCIQWCRCSSGGGPGKVPAQTFIGNSGGINYADDIKAALNDWAGQPYNSPWVYYCTNCSSSQIQLTIEWADLSQNPNIPNPSLVCGWTQAWSDGQGLVTNVVVQFNNQQHWWDGPNNNGYCDAKATAYHELGHAIGTLGHSSAPGNAMFWNGGAGAIGGADQQGLNAIYGPYKGTNNGGSQCPGCQFQTLCGLSVNPCNPSPSVNYEGYLEKAWDLSQGVSAPNPVSIITPAACVPWDNGPYLAWAECVKSTLTN